MIVIPMQSRMPEGIARLYAELDMLVGIIENSGASEDARRDALRRRHAVEEALANRQA